MKRQQLLKLLVLREIMDDSEEPNHIYENVAKEAAVCGVPATRQIVYLLLLELVAHGLARSYDIQRRPIVAFNGVPQIEEIDRYCFLRTGEGRAVFLGARESGPWPFNDEGDLVSGWTPPPE